MTSPSRTKFASRMRAAGLHLLLSCLIAAGAALLVFLLWYPGQYRNLAGGRGLFLLVVAVDVVTGPLLTFVVFDKAKGWAHLRRDLLMIGLMQIAALIYGLHTVYQVRPVALVFERDRFRVISAADVYVRELDKARPEYQRLPLTGPWTLGTRASASPAEKTETLFLSLEGYDVAQRPTYWQSYSESRLDAKNRSIPVAKLGARYPERRADLATILGSLNINEERTRFLPLTARVDAVVLLDEEGNILGFAPFDGFL